MDIELYVTHKQSFDLDNISASEQIDLISFDLNVLNKYRKDSDYIIKLDDGVGTLSDHTGFMEMKIDVNEKAGHLSTFLYCLNALPRIELKHFIAFNIYPRELSERARRLWIFGLER